VLIAKGQRVALLLSAAAIIATVLMPPWKYIDVSPAYFAGYSWLWAPMGRSPCRIQPTAEILNAFRERPQELATFTELFGCRPDQVARPSDIAWNALALEWAAILLVSGLVVASLHGRARNNMPEPATQSSRSTQAAERPDGGSPVFKSQPMAVGGLPAVAPRLSALMKATGKIAYPLAVFLGWAVAVILTRKLPFAPLYVGVFFWVWLRHLYRSEGSKVAFAALVLVTISFAVPLCLLVLTLV
jgi:hypothetical protein